MTQATREQQAAALEKDWAENPRWKGIKRGYSAADVVRLRGSLPIEHTLAKRGAEKLWNLINTEPFVNTLGALTGNQAMQQVKAGLKAIYLSGWQVAGDANSNGEMYPDQSLYSVDSVPKVVQEDQQHLPARRPDPVERRQERHRLLRADRGRRRGRLRRRAERLRADEGDDRSRRRRRALRGPAGLGEEVRPHGRQGAGADARGRGQAGRGAPGRRRDGHADRAARAHRRRSRRPGDQRRRRQRQAVLHRRAHRRRLLPHRRPASSRRISRGLAYAPYADLVWCETGKPDLAFAKAFADAIHAKFPGKLLAYNCSPSFNWKKNLDDATIAKFQRELGAMGYKFQFITLAGFHSLNYSMFELAYGYARNSMSAFVELQEKEFAAAEKGFTAVKHQREVGTGYFDAVTTTIEQRSLDRGAEGLDRGRAVLRLEARVTASPGDGSGQPAPFGAGPLRRGFSRVAATPTVTARCAPTSRCNRSIRCPR